MMIASARYLSLFLLLLVFPACLLRAADPKTEPSASDGLLEARPIVFAPLQKGQTPPNSEPSISKASPTEGTSKDESEDRIAVRMQELLKPVSSIGVNAISESEKVPENKAMQYATHGEIYIAASVHPFRKTDRYTSAFYHNPLYFEEPNLERCGNACGIASTAVSATHFLSSAILLPYNMAKDPPCTCHRTLGDCRCCQEMPCQRPFQCSLRGFVSEGAAVAGFVFLLL